MARCAVRGNRSAILTICRVGLSATAAPLDLLARFLVGQDRHCLVAEARAEKKSIVEVFSPIRQNIRIRRLAIPARGFTRSWRI